MKKLILTVASVAVALVINAQTAPRKDQKSNSQKNKMETPTKGAKRDSSNTGRTRSDSTGTGTGTGMKSDSAANYSTPKQTPK